MCGDYSMHAHAYHKKIYRFLNSLSIIVIILVRQIEVQVVQILLPFRVPARSALKEES